MRTYDDVYVCVYVYAPMYVEWVRCAIDMAHTNVMYVFVVEKQIKNAYC